MIAGHMSNLHKMTSANLVMMAISILLVSVALVGVSCITEGIEPRVSRCREEGIMAQEAFSLIEDNKNNADFITVDLRWPQDFEKEHIEGAINIDCTNEAFRDELDKLDRNKTYLIYAYCACGGVGWNALRTMEELGFKKVCNMWGGIEQWREEGLPTVE